MPTLVFTKHPNEKLPLTVDWTTDADDLGSTVDTSTWHGSDGGSIPAGITKVSDTVLAGNKKTQAIFSGGTDGTDYALINKAVFDDAGATTLEQAVIIQVRGAVPAATDGLTTAQRIIDELSITSRKKQNLIDDMILEASAAIESYCGRKFKQEALAEKVAGNGRKVLSIARPPIISISSITYDGTAEDSTLYEIHDADAGLIYKKDGFIDTSAVLPLASSPEEPGSERKLYTVNYTGGYVLPGVTGRTLPYDIERACIRMVQFYLNAPKNPNIKRQSVPQVYDVEYAHMEGGNSIPPEIARMLDPYRMVF